MKLHCIVLTLLTILLTGCNKPASSDNNKHIATTIIPDSLLFTDCIPKNFTTRLGTKVMYTRIGSDVKLSWSNGVYNRSYDSLYNCYKSKSGEIWDFIPKYESETKNYLLFTNTLWTSGGENSAPLEFYSIILPKNTNDSIYQKDFFIKASGNYIVYGDGMADVIHLLNLETKKEQHFSLVPRSYVSRSPTMAIGKTVISKNKLLIEYESVENSDYEFLVKKIFDIKI